MFKKGNKLSFLLVINFCTCLPKAKLRSYVRLRLTVKFLQITQIDKQPIYLGTLCATDNRLISSHSEHLGKEEDPEIWKTYYKLLHFSWDFWHVGLLYYHYITIPGKCLQTMIVSSSPPISLRTSGCPVQLTLPVLSIVGIFSPCLLYQVKCYDNCINSYNNDNSSHYTTHIASITY